MSKNNEIKFTATDSTINDISNFFKEGNKLKLILISTLIIFHEPLEKIINTILVENVFAYCKSNLVNDIIFGVTILSIIFYFSSKKIHIIANNTLFILSATSLFYLYYRISESTWTFTPFQIYYNIKYFDILPLTTALSFITWSKKFTKKNKKVSGNTPFFDDEPLKDNKSDKLGYSKYAKTIATKIEATQLESSFAIGINGKWGMGKTSFFNLVKRELNNEENIIIDFNSWNSSSPEAIIQDFFNTLQESLKPFYSSLAHQLNNYSEKLISISNNSITQSIKSTLGIFIDDNSVISLYKQINHKLKKIDKKIIIFIDDLDRLDTKEIIEVMRLIRNTASFYNTFFIVAYDRDYALKAISNYNPQNYELFLEKIFQLEINLPYFNKYVFREKLANNLKTILLEDYHNDINEILFKQPYRGGINFNNWLTSMRDVTRLTNSISTTLNDLQGEVLLSEFLYLELFRLKYPSAYEEFSRNHLKFLETKEYRQYKYKYELNKDESFKKHLEKNKDRLSITEDSISNILEILNIIFPRNLYLIGDKENLSVVFPSNFYTYFTYHITDDKLSIIKFSNARRLSQEEFNKAVNNWVALGLEIEVAEKLENTNDYDNKEDFEKIITAIFYLANLKSNKSISQSIKITFTVKSLSDKLNNYEERISNKYYNNNSNEYYRFIESLLMNAPLPYIFEREIVREWLYDFDENTRLPKENLKIIAISYFKSYCDKIESLKSDDSHFWNLFNTCSYKNRNEDNGYQSGVIHIEEAKDIIKTFASDKDLDGFLRELITIERRHESTFAIDYIVLSIWQSWEEFGAFLYMQKSKQSIYLDEFIKFFNDFSKNEPKTYIDFKFKIIPIDKKSRNS